MQSSAKLAANSQSDDVEMPVLHKPRSDVFSSVEFIAGQNRILEMVATGRPADEVLAELCKLIERIEPRAVVSVLVLDRERRCFGRVVTPSLHPNYSAALVGAPIDPPHLGTCGAAVFYGEPVQSLEIVKDARWHPKWRDLCLEYGLQACQSTPIRASDGTPLGSFLVSFREPSTAAAWNPKLIDVGVHLASLTLERDAREHVLQNVIREKDVALSKLEAMLNHAPVGFAFFDHAHQCIRMNGFLTENYGGPTEALIGRPLSDVSPRVATVLAPQIDRVLRTGEAVLDLEVVCAPIVETAGRIHWLTSLYPVFQDGKVAWVGAVMIDITQRKQDEENRKLLLAELSHRVKNTLAVVQSIITQTLKDGFAKDFAQTLRGRIHALAQTHTVLSEADWRGAGLGVIVRAELAPYMGVENPRVVIDGPEIELTPRAAQTFGLAIHELATNAAKYGSLSASDGCLHVRWCTEGEGNNKALRLSWREEGGPTVVPPQRFGFGRRLIEYSLQHDLGGEAQLDFHPQGLVGSFTVPAHTAIAA